MTAAVVFMFAVLVTFAVRDVLRERHADQREREWREERRELLSRIQHPEVFIPPSAFGPEPKQEPREPVDDDFERVGGVFYEDEDA